MNVFASTVMQIAQNGIHNNKNCLVYQIEVNRIVIAVHFQSLLKSTSNANRLHNVSVEKKQVETAIKKLSLIAGVRI